MCQDRNLSQPHSVQISHLPSSPGLLNFLGKVSRQVRGRGFKADGDILVREGLGCCLMSPALSITGEGGWELEDCLPSSFWGRT